MIVKAKKEHSEVAHNFRNRYIEPENLQKPSNESSEKHIRSAREKIDAILGLKKQAAFGTNIQKLGKTTTQMIKFTSKGDSGEGGKQRLARVESVQIDPLMPPLLKHRKLPRGAGSPPPQILRSPPRKLTQKDMDDWKVPPCISNWRNSRGYTIPIHMRLAADGRSLQHNTINQSFADIIDSLYIAERQSKLELQQRGKIQKSVAYKQYLKKQQALRNAALQARQEVKRIQQADVDSDQGERKQREQFRYHRQRQLDRQMKMKKTGAARKKQIKMEQRDISQRVALGQAQPTNQQLMLDQRLFDNAGGLQAGNSDSQGDNMYDKPLFADRSTLQAQTISKGTVGDHNVRNQPIKFQKYKQSVFGMDNLLGNNPQKKIKP